ncbi:MAG TPA: M24 family metallopeptidase, partial [Myxococcaceae bacterium]|nr:M24 family metallopeptidase [Myxococcaceae bacterium]
MRPRFQAIRQVMEREHLDAIYLRPGANLSYLAGIRRREPHATDTNAYGDWIEGAYIGSEIMVLVAPRMGSEFFVQQARGKPWVTDVRVVLEDEDPQVVFRDTLQRVAPSAHRVAVDDRAWVPTVLQFHAAGIEVVPVGSLIAPLRMIKDPDELAAMRKAARLADEVYAETLKILRPGVSETDVAHEVDYQFSRRGANYPSFVTGIRFTHPNSDRPHSERQTSRVLALGDAVTF